MVLLHEKNIKGCIIMWLILGIIAIVATFINLYMYVQEKIINLQWQWDYHLQH